MGTARTAPTAPLSSNDSLKRKTRREWPALLGFADGSAAVVSPPVELGSLGFIASCSMWWSPCFEDSGSRVILSFFSKDARDKVGPDWRPVSRPARRQCQ